MLNRLGLMAVLAALVWSAGCKGDSPTVTNRSADDQAALDEMRSASFEAMRAGLSVLDSLTFVENVTLQEVADRADSVLVIATQSFSNQWVAGSVSEHSSTDSDLDAESAIDSVSAADLVARPPLLPFDVPPPFLASRQEHLYTYSRRDTTIGSRTYLMFTARNVADSGEQSTLVVDPDSREVVELFDSRRNSAVLFRADNVVRIRVSETDGQRFVDSFDYDLTLKIPFRKERHFRLQKRYSLGSSGT